MAVPIWGYLRLPTRCEGEAKVIPLSDLSSAESMACNESATLHDAILPSIHTTYMTTMRSRATRHTTLT